METMLASFLADDDHGKAVLAFFLADDNHGKAVLAFFLADDDHGKTVLAFFLAGDDHGKTVLAFFLTGDDRGKTVLAFFLTDDDYGKTVLAFFLADDDCGKTVLVFLIVNNRFGAVFLRFCCKSTIFSCFPVGLESNATCGIREFGPYRDIGVLIENPQHISTGTNNNPGHHHSPAWKADAVFTLFAEPVRQKRLLALARKPRPTPFELKYIVQRILDRTLKRLASVRSNGFVVTKADTQGSASRHLGLSNACHYPHLANAR